MNIFSVLESDDEEETPVVQAKAKSSAKPGFAMKLFYLPLFLTRPFYS
jgi:hypothetical protein